MTKQLEAIKKHSWPSKGHWQKIATYLLDQKPWQPLNSSTVLTIVSDNISRSAGFLSLYLVLNRANSTILECHKHYSIMSRWNSLHPVQVLIQRTYVQKVSSVRYWSRKFAVKVGLRDKLFMVKLFFKSWNTLYGSCPIPWADMLQDRYNERTQVPYRKGLYNYDLDVSATLLTLKFCSHKFFDTFSDQNIELNQAYSSLLATKSDNKIHTVFQSRKKNSLSFDQVLNVFNNSFDTVKGNNSHKQCTIPKREENKKPRIVLKNTKDAPVKIQRADLCETFDIF